MFEELLSKAKNTDESKQSNITNGGNRTNELEQELGGESSPVSSLSKPNTGSGLSGGIELIENQNKGGSVNLLDQLSVANKESTIQLAKIKPNTKSEPTKITKKIKKDGAPNDPIKNRGLVSNKKQQQTSFGKVTQIYNVEELPRSVSGTKRFRVKFAQIDRNGKSRGETIRFGKRNQEEFIDTESQVTQIRRLSRLIESKYAKDPMKDTHWDIWLLNTKPSIHEAVAYYRDQHGLL